jgi:hypothetical protein
MKRSWLILTALMLCATTLAAPPPDPLTTVISGTIAAADAPSITTPLPFQVGIVRERLPGNFIPGETSEIVRSDKRDSLCYANRKTISSFCVPIIAGDSHELAIAQLDIGLLFNATPASTASKAGVQRAATSFLAGLARAQRALIRHNARPRVERTNVSIGGGCGYEDDDGFPTCEGGGEGGGSWGGGDYPGAGGDWGIGGDSGAGIDLSGASSTGCMATPFGWLCTGRRGQPWEDPWTTPRMGGSPEPRMNDTSHAPWFPQSWCNFAEILCSDGQTPEDNDRGGNAALSGKSMSECYAICEAVEEVERQVCFLNRRVNVIRDQRSLNTCLDKATARKIACYATARRLTNNGQNPVP